MVEPRALQFPYLRGAKEMMEGLSFDQFPLIPRAALIIGSSSFNTGKSPSVRHICRASLLLI